VCRRWTPDIPGSWNGAARTAQLRQQGAAPLAFGDGLSVVLMTMLRSTFRISRSARSYPLLDAVFLGAAIGGDWGAICAHRPTRGLAAAEWKSAGSRGSPPLDGSLFHVKPVRNSDTALSRDDGSILVTGHLARECRLAHRNQWWLLPFTNEPHG